MRFRPQRGGLATALKEQKEFYTIREFELIVYDEAKCSSLLIGGTPIRVEKYGQGLDTRMDPPWDTHIVTMEGVPGVIGFTDGPLENL